MSYQQEHVYETPYVQQPVYIQDTKSPSNSKCKTWFLVLLSLYSIGVTIALIVIQQQQKNVVGCILGAII